MHIIYNIQNVLSSIGSALRCGPVEQNLGRSPDNHLRAAGAQIDVHPAPGLPSVPVALQLNPYRILSGSPRKYIAIKVV